MPLPLVGATFAGMGVVLARFLVPYIILQAVIAIGLTVITFTGMDFLTDRLVSEVRGSTNSLPADLVGILAMAGIFDWMEVVLSSWVAHVNIISIRQALTRISLSKS